VRPKKARQISCLPCVFPTTHGKVLCPLPPFEQMKHRFLKKLCRAFFPRRTSNPRVTCIFPRCTQTHEFVVCFLSCAGQNIFLP
jgi:hypothetical protein